MICNNLSINSQGHLTFAGKDTVALAAAYGTPLYLLDEDRIRENCRIYKRAIAREFGENSMPLYAHSVCSIYEMQCQFMQWDFKRFLNIQL